AYEVLNGAATSERVHLINFAIYVLTTLDGPVPVSVLRPHLTTAHESATRRQSMIATLLARGDDEQLKALKTIYGRLPGRTGWQQLCLGIDSSTETGTGEQPPL